jgi:hypothetical protein
MQSYLNSLKLAFGKSPPKPTTRQPFRVVVHTPHPFKFSMSSSSDKELEVIDPSLADTVKNIDKPTMYIIKAGAAKTSNMATGLP